MRFMGFLFVGLTFLAGITLGSIEIALINVVLFLCLALLTVQFLEPRFGTNGLVYGMAGAFFLSVMWPFALIPFAGPECEGEDCGDNDAEGAMTAQVLRT